MIEGGIVSLVRIELTVEGGKQCATNPVAMDIQMQDCEKFVLLRASHLVRGKPTMYHPSIYATNCIVDVPCTTNAEAIDVEVIVRINCYIVGEKDLTTKRLTRNFHIPLNHSKGTSSRP